MEKSKNIQNILSKRRIYFAVFICFAIVGFIYWKEYNAGGDKLESLNWSKKAFGYLFLGLVMMFFRDFAYMIRIRLLTDKKLNWRQSFNVILLWEFASAISPGVVGGSAVALFILEKEKIPIGKSTALVIITLIFDNLFYVILIPAVFLFIDINSLFPANLTSIANNGMNLFWMGYSVIFSLTIVLFLSVFYSPRIIEIIVEFIYRLPVLRKRKGKVDQFSQDIRKASDNLKGKSALFWLQLFGITLWSWFARFLVINCVLFAFIELHLFDHIVILGRQLVMWLVMLVTPTPGGSGMAEFAFSELFSDYVGGASLSAVGLALIWRTLSYYPYLLIGPLILPKWLKKN